MVATPRLDLWCGRFKSAITHVYRPLRTKYDACLTDSESAE